MVGEAQVEQHLQLWRGVPWRYPPPPEWYRLDRCRPASSLRLELVAQGILGRLPKACGTGVGTYENREHRDDVHEEHSSLVLGLSVQDSRAVTGAVTAASFMSS
eukprot:scaffold54605_cov60-Phaeocystis_antarctica.AAC.1